MKILFQIVFSILIFLSSTGCENPAGTSSPIEVYVSIQPGYTARIYSEQQMITYLDATWPDDTITVSKKSMLVAKYQKNTIKRLRVLEVEPEDGMTWIIP